MKQIAIHLEALNELGSQRQVVRVGVPLPQGSASVDTAWEVFAPDGQAQLCQTLPLATWPDGSAKWLLVHFLASVLADGPTTYSLCLAETRSSLANQVQVLETPTSIIVESEGAKFEFPRRGTSLISSVLVCGKNVLAEPGVVLQLVDEKGLARRGILESLDVLETGPLVCRLKFIGVIGRGLRTTGEWTITTGSACPQLDITLHNPARARHQRGLWDLGDPGSVLFRSLAVKLSLAGTQDREIHWRELPANSWRPTTSGKLEIVQLSSGGANDQSPCHVDRYGKAPTRGSGFVVRSATGEVRGRRAEPAVAIAHEQGFLAATIGEFWQQFPKSISADAGAIELGLFPEFAEVLHELQGGEQKTTRLAISFAASPAAAASDLLAVQRPIVGRCDRAWIASTGALWRLPGSEATLPHQWRTVASQAIAGPSSFFAKRETADEFGWRNYGDLWADHEEAYYKGPRPIVSHYNNQYDALEGFLLTYLLTGDRHWWELADPLARHVIDIDIYRTKEDKAAYNGGLFWHTDHYVEAATSTHRSYAAINHPQGGGGPANEHNYTSGLLLYHYLTGSAEALNTVVGLAEWVLNMDDGRKHLLGLVQESPTGLASKTTEFSFHGPGRGAGNSLNALLDGWMLTRRAEFLSKIEELVYRTIHPEDDFVALDLANGERRWSYTVFLQSIVRLLAAANECGFDPTLVQHMRASLLHYARWMADHETLYLDQPERLEYPTETWAAQELRKANVLMAAAVYVEGATAEKFRAKALWIYDRAWTSLLGFPTWHFTRPTVLAIQLGLGAAQFAEPGASPKLPLKPDLERPNIVLRQTFVPQREAIRRGIKSPGQLLAMIARLGRFWRWPAALRETWTGYRLRRLWGQNLG